MYTVREIFAFHEKNVRVTDKDGYVRSGMCWAYCDRDSDDTADGFDAYLDVEDVIFPLDEIAKIEEITD